PRGAPSAGWPRRPAWRDRAPGSGTRLSWRRSRSRSSPRSGRRSWLRDGYRSRPSRRPRRAMPSSRPWRAPSRAAGAGPCRDLRSPRPAPSGNRAGRRRSSRAAPSPARGSCRLSLDLRCLLVLRDGRSAAVGRHLGVTAPLALLVEVAPLDDGLRDRSTEEADGANGVVVPRDLVVDQIGVAVGVDHGDHGDAELVGLLDRDLLLLRVDHEKRVGQLAQPLDAAERGQELLALAAKALDLLLGERLR